MIEVMNDTDLGVSMFKDVLDEVLHQVLQGKGEQRHGHGAKMLNQPWRALADQHGAGFLTGQAAKKLGEAAMLRAAGKMSADKYEQEVMGAMAYSAFALMHGRLKDEEIDLVDHPALAVLRKASEC